MQETGITQSSPENIYLRASSVSFPGTQSASSWSSPWIPFKVYYRTVTAVADDLILVELDGGQHSIFYNLLSLGLNFNQGLGGISWPLCPMVLRLLIPRSGEDFLDRLVSVLLLDLGPVKVARSLWTTCLTSLLWSRKCFPFVASSHI